MEWGCDSRRERTAVGQITFWSDNSRNMFLLEPLLFSDQFPPKCPPATCFMAIDHPRSSFPPTYFPITQDKVRKISLQEVSPKENATLYHYFPHNQHLFQLPDCASQQVVPFLAGEPTLDSNFLQLDFPLTQPLRPFPGVQCSLPSTQLLRPTLRLS